MNLWINFYLNGKRDYELICCLLSNIANPLIKKIYLVGEVNYEDEKIVFIKHERPTFGEFLRQIWKYERYSINIIANSDIYFDDTLKLAENINMRECYALSRWDEGSEGLKHFNTRDSQDAWIMRGGINDVEDCEFFSGIAGCDNAFADRLQEGGFKVSNPSLDIHAIHIHANNQTAWTKGEKVPLPYLLITPHHLGEEPSLQRIP